ncbi:MAG: substrate-binding domain-containing protein [Chloroflexota bacterium]
MFKTIEKQFTRVILLALVLSLIPMMVASAADSRPTGPTFINTNGSTTLFPILQLAEYQFPATPLGAGLTVVNNTPPGTGSGHGIRALANQLPIQSSNGGPNEPIDMGLSSAPCSTSNTVRVTNTVFTEGTLTAVTPSTQTTLQCADFTAIPVAKDAITILVNQTRLACINASTPNHITRNMVRAIYEGRTYDRATDTAGATAGTVQHTWSSFWSACPSDTIVPRSRIVGSGTRQSFLDFSGVTSTNEQALINSTGLTRLQGNVDIEAAIAANPTHLSYTGKAFDNPSTAQLALSDTTRPAGQQGPAFPTTPNVADNSYPWSRVIYVYYLTSNPKQAVRNLETFLYSSQMQGNIEKLDFVSIWRSTVPSVPAAQQPAPAWDVDANRVGNILDVSSIGAFFGQTGPASGDPSFPQLRGWVRGDINFDAQVNILDITTFGPRFGATW